LVEYEKGAIFPPRATAKENLNCNFTSMTRKNNLQKQSFKNINNNSSRWKYKEGGL
jgi:hypothetical protein